MSKIKVNINDKVKLWNGEEGEIIEKDMVTYEVEITKDNGYPSKVHIMNIRYLNDEEIDSSELVF